MHAGIGEYMHHKLLEFARHFVHCNNKFVNPKVEAIFIFQVVAQNSAKENQQPSDHSQMEFDRYHTWCYNRANDLTWLEESVILSPNACFYLPYMKEC